MAAWLRHPEGPIRALSFLPSVQHANAGRVSRMPLVGRAGDLIVPPRLDDGRLARSAASGDPIELDEEALAGFLRS